MSKKQEKEVLSCFKIQKIRRNKKLKAEKAYIFWKKRLNTKKAGIYPAYQ